MPKCDCCQREAVAVSMGGCLICRSCDPIIQERMEALRSQGKPVMVSRICREVYLEQFAGGDYMLKNPPRELMDAVKHQAVNEGSTIRDIITRALGEYIERQTARKG